MKILIILYLLVSISVVLGGIGNGIVAITNNGDAGRMALSLIELFIGGLGITISWVSLEN